jgi:hypothetical protein
MCTSIPIWLALDAIRMTVLDRKLNARNPGADPQSPTDHRHIASHSSVRTDANRAEAISH